MSGNYNILQSMISQISHYDVIKYFFCVSWPCACVLLFIIGVTLSSATNVTHSEDNYDRLISGIIVYSDVL